MVRSRLDKLAKAYGVALSYLSETGKRRRTSDAAKRDLLGALGVSARTDAEIDAALASLRPQPTDDLRPVPTSYAPDWLLSGRAWGITCQLYGLRSRRNWGIGDFEDLARVAEIMAAEGADFVGVNPLHALFMAAPQRFGPYSPSSRRFLNPLYIATDFLPGAVVTEPARLAAARASELVDYCEVAAHKQSAFEAAYTHFCRHQLGTNSSQDRDFASFCALGGVPLVDFALFETISETAVARGRSAGWHGWPDELRIRSSPAVELISRESAERIRFHQWLQWTADRQLADAQRRALAAGMRIGLYLDLAVGVAPDGADTWCAPGEVLTGARVGAPPDQFNAAGQDWGLTPLSPVLPADCGEGLFHAVLEVAMRHAGAVRLDHAMALKRLYLIPEGHSSADGGYVHYPMNALLSDVAETSRKMHSIVIGEDLGTVPQGFRETMRECAILGYRVLFFERSKAGFLPPDCYTAEALACISTHDLPTLNGWWQGRDLVERERLGLTGGEDLQKAWASRRSEKQALISALAGANVLPKKLIAFIQPGAMPPPDLPDELSAAVHKFIARTPCRLVAAQLEDLLGSTDCLNIPGTTDEHPNWRRKIPVEIEHMAGFAQFRAICSALREERPRQP